MPPAPSPGWNGKQLEAVQLCSTAGSTGLCVAESTLQTVETTSCCCQLPVSRTHPGAPKVLGSTALLGIPASRPATEQEMQAACYRLKTARPRAVLARL